MRTLLASSIIEITDDLDKAEVILGKDHPALKRGVVEDLEYMLNQVKIKRFTLGDMAEKRDTPISFYEYPILEDLEMSGVIKIY